jgi:hypothetical protein
VIGSLGVGVLALLSCACWADFSLAPEESSVVGTYQAEDHTLESGCSQKSNDLGFTGTGYMEYGGNGSFVEWGNVTAPSTEMYKLTFRYSNGSLVDKPCVVSINGAAIADDAVPFSSTGWAANWSSTSVDVRLSKGRNKIRLTANTENGSLNLDKMDVEYLE